MSTLSMPFRVASVYVNDPLMDEHRQAMRCRETEARIELGLFALSLLSKFEVVCQEDALRGELTPDDPVWAGFQRIYRQWLAMSEKLLESAARHQNEGYTVEKLSEFLSAVDEVQGRVDLAEFELELPPIEEMANRARPDNPDPARYGD
jgi:hypothetical protein